MNFLCTAGMVGTVVCVSLWIHRDCTRYARNVRPFSGTAYTSYIYIYVASIRCRPVTIFVCRLLQIDQRTALNYAANEAIKDLLKAYFSQQRR